MGQKMTALVAVLESKKVFKLMMVVMVTILAFEVKKEITNLLSRDGFSLPGSLRTSLTKPQQHERDESTRLHNRLRAKMLQKVEHTFSESDTQRAFEKAFNKTRFPSGLRDLDGYSRLTAINPSNPDLIWAHIDGHPSPFVLMLLWTVQPPLALSRFQKSSSDLWLTVVPQLKHICHFVSRDFLDHRISQLLGRLPLSSLLHSFEDLNAFQKIEDVPPVMWADIGFFEEEEQEESGKTNTTKGAKKKTDKQERYAVEMWVHPSDLFRPCPDPEVSDHECEREFPSCNRLLVAGSHIGWINDHCRSNSLPSLPPSMSSLWTQLGYTFDWGHPSDHIGLSEFVLPSGSQFYVHSVRPTSSYCHG